jgi:hypothetical protein
VLIVCVTAVPASAQLDKFLKGLGIGQPTELSEAKIGSGLKEALRIGTENAVKLTGKTDGYFLNQAIKILMPEKLQKVEQGLRLVGYGPQVDEFVLSMNRAAERAGPSCQTDFLGCDWRDDDWRCSEDLEGQRNGGHGLLQS